MNSIRELFEELDGIITGNGIEEDAIRKAEEALDIVFAEDYREYLSLYGIAAYKGHELTGLVGSPRVNVVSVTMENRKRYPEHTSDLYVIEEIDVEEIVIWQSQSGEIYCSSPYSFPEKVYDSLYEYLKR